MNARSDGFAEPTEEQMIAAVLDACGEPEKYVERLMQWPPLTRQVESVMHWQGRAVLAALRALSDPQEGAPQQPRELLCEDCNRGYEVWYADNEFWNQVMRPNGAVPGEPFLCPTCFLLRASKAGIRIARVTRAHGEVAP